MTTNYKVKVQFITDRKELFKAEDELKRIDNRLERLSKQKMTPDLTKEISMLKARKKILTEELTLRRQAREQQALQYKQQSIQMQKEQTQMAQSLMQLTKKTAELEEQLVVMQLQTAELKEQNSLQEKAAKKATKKTVGDEDKVDGRRTSIRARTSRALGQSFLEAPLYSASFAIMAGIGASVQQFIQLDKTLTRIAIVTERNVDSMQAFARYANDAGKALGVTGQRFAEASLIFLQQGGLAADYANSLAESSIKLANITGAQAEDTSEYITAIANSFNLLELESTKAGDKIVDMLAALDAASGTSADEIANAFKKAASSFAAAGFSAQEGAAAIAVISETTRQAPELIGTGLKTLIGNLSEIKVGSEEFAGITNKLQDVASQFGVSFSLMDESTGNLKSIPNLLAEISTLYKTNSNEAFRRSLIEAVAGKEQRDRFIALITNQERYNELIKIATYSSGAADRAQSKYLESITGKLEQFKNEWEELVLNIIDADWFKSFIDSMNALLSNFNELLKSGDGFRKILLEISAILGTIYFSKKAGSISSLTSLVAGLGAGVQGPQQATFSGRMKERMANIGQSVQNLGAKTGQTIKSNLGAAGAIGTIGAFQVAQTLGREELTGAEKATGTIAALLPAVGSLFGPIGTLTGLLASLGLSFMSVNKGVTAARDELNKLASTAKESLSTRQGQKEVQDLLDIISESGIDKTTDRYMEAANRLGELMPAVVATQDEYGNTVLRSTDEVKKYIDAQKELINLQQALDAPEILKGYFELIDIETKKQLYNLDSLNLTITTIFANIYAALKYSVYNTLVDIVNIFVNLANIFAFGKIPKLLQMTFGEAQAGTMEKMNVGKISNEARLTPEERRVSEIQEELLRSQAAQKLENYFNQIIAIDKKFSESQAVDIERAFRRAITEPIENLDPALVEFKKAWEDIINGTGTAEEKAQAVALLTDKYGNTLANSGKRLSDAENLLKTMLTDRRFAGKNKQQIIKEIQATYPEFTEADFKAMGGDAYYKFVEETIEDVKYYVDDQARKAVFKEVLKELFVDVSDEFLDSVYNSVDDFSQGFGYLTGKLKKDWTYLNNTISGLLKGGMTDNERGQAYQLATTLFGEGNFYEQEVLDKDKKVIGYTIKLAEGYILDQIAAMSKKSLGENKEKNLEDRYSKLFSDLSLRQAKADSELEKYLENTDQWISNLQKIISLNKEEISLNNQQIQDYKKLAAAETDPSKKIDYQNKINDLLIKNIQLNDTRLKLESQSASAPYLKTLKGLQDTQDNLNSEQEKYSRELKNTIEYSDDWQKVQDKIIDATKQDIQLSQQKIDTFKSLSLNQSLSASDREKYADMAEEESRRLLELENQLLDTEEQKFSAPYIDRINKANEAVEDQSALLGTLTKSSDGYLEASDKLIQSQMDLLTSKMIYLQALEAEGKLTAAQEQQLEDLRDEIFQLSDVIKKSATELALDKFYKAMYGEADLNALKERYDINLRYYDDFINAQEQIIEKSRLQLEIQQEIESSTDATYKANLKYLETKLKDAKLTNQQITAIRAQIGLLKSLSAAAGPGEAQQFKLTRTRAGTYRFAPSGPAGTTAEKKAAALEAATTFEQQAVEQYRSIADQIFAAETQAALLTSQGRTKEAATLTQLAGSLRGQLGAQAGEVERAKVVSALVQQGKLGIAARVSTGQISAQEAMAGMTPEQRAAIQESIDQSKISVLSPEVTSTERLIYTNEKLIKALEELKVAIKAAETMASTSPTYEEKEAIFTDAYYKAVGTTGATEGTGISEKNQQTAYQAHVAATNARNAELERLSEAWWATTDETLRKKYADDAEAIRKHGVASGNREIDKPRGKRLEVRSFDEWSEGRFETGGYTGEFDGGRMAILHEKELVLNKMDTENMLNAIGLVRQMPSLRRTMPAIGNRMSDSPAQNIVINADFPAVSSADQIKQAFASMSNMALQYAYKTKSF